MHDSFSSLLFCFKLILWCATDLVTVRIGLQVFNIIKNYN